MARVIDLPFSGPDGSTSFVDGAGNPWTPINSAQLQGDALYLDGVGSGLYTNTTPELRIGLGAFVMDFEVNITAADFGSYRIVFDQHATTVQPWTLQVVVVSGGIYMDIYSSSFGARDVVRVSSGVAGGTWHRVTIERHADMSVTLKVDGIVVATGSLPEAIDAKTWTTIGGRRDASGSLTYPFRGYIRNFTLDITPIPVETGRIAAWVRSSYVGWDRAQPAPPGVGFARGNFVKGLQLFTTPLPVATKVALATHITRGVPPWWGASGSTTQLPTYKLRGRVMQRDPDGVLPDAPVPSARVVLYFRRLHALVDIRISDEDGYVQFDNLMPGNQAYYAVAFDPEGAPLQNAVIWDHLTPEPGP